MQHAAPKQKNKTGYHPKWMDTKKKFPFHGYVYSGLDIRKFKGPMDKKKFAMLKPFIRKSLDYQLYTYLQKAVNKEPGFDPYSLPTRDIAKRLGLSTMTVQMAARQWRKYFGLKEQGAVGGSTRIGIPITPKQLAFEKWIEATQKFSTTAKKTSQTPRVINMTELIEEAGKMGLLTVPKVFYGWIRRFNNYLDEQAQVKIVWGTLSYETTLNGVREFLRKKGITGAKSVIKRLN